MRRILSLGLLMLLPVCFCGKIALLRPTTTSSPTAPLSATQARTATPLPTDRPLPIETPISTAVPTFTTWPTATSSPTIPPSPTLTPTPTPTPTPAPLGFYLIAYQPSCPAEERRLRVEVLDENGQPLNGIHLEFRAAEGEEPVLATSGEGEEGATEFALAEGPGGDDWTVEIKDESGGGLPVEGIRAHLPGEECPGGRSYRLVFQQGLSDPAPATYAPITFTPIGPRGVPEGPWSPDQVRPLAEWPRPPHDNGTGIHFLPIGYYDDWVVDRLIELMKEMRMRWCVVLYNDENMLRRAAIKFRDAGIMVVWRPNIRPAGGYLYIQRDLDILNEVGMPPYIQLYNEPEVEQEWVEY
ncbi:MAG: hypothetical protein ACETWB_02905, partial [Anaerolineae bacterium]